MKDGNIGEAVRCMLVYLTSFHGTVTRKILTELGLSPKQMDEYEISALMNSSKIGARKWRQIVSSFSTYTGLNRNSFSVSEEAWHRLGADHGEIKHGKWSYDKKDGKRPEAVQWWTMDPAAELELRLDDFSNESPDFHPDKIDFIQSIYTGDHGIGRFRFGAKLVIALKDRNQGKFVLVYPLADVKCKKDTGEVLKETVHKNLAEGINKVEHGRVKLAQIDKGK